MKIEKLNLNTLKIILTVEELSSENISIRDIETGKKKAQNFFFDIIENSSFADEFLQNDTKLLVEAYVSHDDKLIVTITKVTHNTSNLSSNSKVSCTSYQLYMFCNIEKLVEFAVLCVDKNLFVGSNNLYMYNDVYFLTFSRQTVYQEKFKKTFYALTEYSDKYSSKDTAISTIKENADILLQKNAINKIRSYVFE